MTDQQIHSTIKQGKWQGFLVNNLSDPTLETQAMQTLLTFLQTVQFTGVELDFEGYAQWTAQQYSGYKQFLIPSYGYHAATGSTDITEDTHAQSQTYPGYTTATRDNSSGEMMWTHAGISYDYADAETLAAKRVTIERLGIHYISVWSLGGNLWFTGSEEPSS